MMTRMILRVHPGPTRPGGARREDRTGPQRSRLLGRHETGIGRNDWTRNVCYHFVVAVLLV
jgi:hypothetical protein